MNMEEEIKWKKEGEALAEMDKRLQILKEDSWAMDEIAGELMEKRAEIQQEIAPKLAAIQNIEYKLVDLTNRKTGLLVQYRSGIKVLEGLQSDPQNGMEVV